MKNSEMLEGIMKAMIQMVEMQTTLGKKLQSLEREIKAVQDAIADLDIRWEK